MILDKLYFTFYYTYMSSADIFMTPTHNACCFPSAIIALKSPLRKTGFFFVYLLALCFFELFPKSKSSSK